MGVGAGLYMYDVVVKSLRLLSHLLMSFLSYQENTLVESFNCYRRCGACWQLGCTVYRPNFVL